MKRVRLLLLLSPVALALVYFVAGPAKKNEPRGSQQKLKQTAVGGIREAGQESLSSASNAKLPEQFDIPAIDEPRSASILRESYRQVMRNEENPSNKQTEGERVTAAIAEQSRTEKNRVTQSDEGGTISLDSGGSPPDVAPQPRLWLPAAMLEPDKSIAITTELQVAEWERLQEDFVQAVNGRAPGSESEREAWIRAQQKNDELFRLKFGWDAFNAQQLKAYREGLAPSQP
jgi:hypothetical protein